MSGTGSNSNSEDTAPETWTNEYLSVSRRKELLERELSRLGFRKPAAGGGASHGGQQQQQPQGDGPHPQAGGDTASHAG